MEGAFRDWLSERVGDEPQKVSRRELARRLSERDGDPESHRRTVRRILNGDTPSPTQRTRNAIQDALEDWSAPSAADDAASEPTLEEMVLYAREGIRHLRKLERWALAQGAAA